MFFSHTGHLWFIAPIARLFTQRNYRKKWTLPLGVLHIFRPQTVQRLPSVCCYTSRRPPRRLQGPILHKAARRLRSRRSRDGGNHLGHGWDGEGGVNIARCPGKKTLGGYNFIAKSTDLLEHRKFFLGGNEVFFWINQDCRVGSPYCWL